MSAALGSVRGLGAGAGAAKAQNLFCGKGMREVAGFKPLHRMAAVLSILPGTHTLAPWSVTPVCVGGTVHPFSTLVLPLHSCILPSTFSEPSHPVR